MRLTVPTILNAAPYASTFFQRNFTSSSTIPAKYKSLITASSSKGNYHYIPRENTGHFYKGLFETSLAQQQLGRPGSIFESIITPLSNLPLIITPQGNSEDEVKRFSYTSRFKVITLRDQFYDNPYITDLYYLHELGHALTLQPSPHLDFQHWKKLTEGNEISNSLATEVLIYFDIPELRKKTIKEEIWVDKFLTNKVLLSQDHSCNLDLFNNHRQEFMKKISFFYLRSYCRGMNRIQDENEKWMVYYREKTKKWHAIWQDLYPEAETMIKRYSEAVDSPQDYLEWLERNTQQNVLFYEPAFKYANTTTSIDHVIPMTSRRTAT
jgi:hypothetical protein